MYGFDRPGVTDPSTIGEAAYSPTTELPPLFDRTAPRFPITRQGYNCAAVDHHVAELQRELAVLDGELAALRVATPSRNEAAEEIERLGQQTSAILLAAHDGAQEITRRAQAEAERCLTDAASNALAITSKANQEVNDLQAQIDELGRQRDRILREVGKSAEALSSLAAGSSANAPPEPDPPR